MEKTAWAVTALLLVITLLFMNGGALGLEAMAHTMGYENRLFDQTRVHTIDIVMADWDEFIDNAASEEYYAADLVIDGEVYKNIAIRGKGNTSLSTVSSMDSHRYSFKVEFDHYDNSITYHGLDKLCLNNLIQDSTMMKDYLTYTMMHTFGVNSSLCSFASITVNGRDWGLYLAVEGVEESFLERNYGTVYGELYKPDSMNMGGGRGNGKDFDMESFLDRKAASGDTGNDAAPPQIQGIGSFARSQTPKETEGTLPERESFAPSQMQGNFPQIQRPGQKTPASGNREDASSGDRGGSGGMGAADVKLQYVDDDTASYSNIWNNAKTDITPADQTRLIESLKKLSNKEQLESVVDIEQVMRYFVVHNYVCNGDSYTGSMIHNYYLYEENGRLAMIPWDYNLAFGTFHGSSGQSAVNTPIDAPVSGGIGEDRPMWNWILSGEDYTNLYHQYFADFLNTVDVQALIDHAYTLIKPYVEKDPTAFYTYEEFEAGVAAMRQFCTLRSESISMQLAAGETTADMGYADASGLTLTDMGSMGRGFGGETPAMPEGFAPPQMQGDMGGRSSGQAPRETAPALADTSGDTASPTGGERPSRGNTQFPGDSRGTGMNSTGTSASPSASLLWLAVSALILGAGLLIAKMYKR